MATAQIVATVHVHLDDDAERYPLDPIHTRSEDLGYVVTGFTLDHPEGEYVRLSVIDSWGQEHDPIVSIATRLPEHVQALLQSARRTLEVIRALESVTTEAVR